MNYCLICHEEIIQETSWKTLAFPDKEKRICSNCEGRLSFIATERCSVCSKPTLDQTCDDCQDWQRYYKGKDPLQFNVSVFRYQTFLKDVITSWKYRGDYVIIEALKDFFINQFKESFSEIKQPLIVPIALSEERAKERGFNQALQLAEFLPGQLVELFIRTSGEKQAKKSRRERIEGENFFQLRSREKINRPVILVDDLYTTGSTLRQAASLLVEINCKEVYSYTLIRG